MVVMKLTVEEDKSNTVKLYAKCLHCSQLQVLLVLVHYFVTARRPPSLTSYYTVVRFTKNPSDSDHICQNSEVSDRHFGIWFVMKII